MLIFQGVYPTSSPETRIIISFVGDPYKPSFPHCYWKGGQPTFSVVFFEFLSGWS